MPPTMKKRTRSTDCLGNRILIKASGFMPAANSPIETREAIAPKPADQSRPFFNPETIPDRAKPMEDNPLPQITVIRTISSIWRRRAPARISIGWKAYLETTTQVASSTAITAARQRNRIFSWIFFASIPGSVRLCKHTTGCTSDQMF